ncbi:MAG: GntR family transcriptional regulator [Treponema sp.]|nr:GntR family transcriptional regulator [Treponema sp.]
MEIQKVNLSDQIYDNLKKSILTGKISLGEKLINRELQKKYGVSSTPVRDAINRLYIDGLVDNITNSGAKIKNLNLEFMLEVNEMVTLFCCASIELASKRADKTAVCNTIPKIIEKQEMILGSDKYYTYDYQFHKTFFDHCGNSQLFKCYEQYRILWEMFLVKFNFKEEQALSIKEHKSIYENFCDGHYNKASEIVKQHFLRSEEIMKKHMT